MWNLGKIIDGMIFGISKDVVVWYAGRNICNGNSREFLNLSIIWLAGSNRKWGNFKFLRI